MWTTPAQRALFDSMHVADRRHGLDVVARLRAEGHSDPDLLVAGLLHDAGKGQTGVWPRVIWSLGEQYGGWIVGLAAAIPGMRRSIERIRVHAEESARLAADAGCRELTVELIRHQARPRDPEYGRALKLADDAE